MPRCRRRNSPERGDQLSDAVFGGRQGRFGRLTHPDLDPPPRGALAALRDEAQRLGYASECSTPAMASRKKRATAPSCRVDPTTPGSVGRGGAGLFPRQLPYPEETRAGRIPDPGRRAARGEASLLLVPREFCVDVRTVAKGAAGEHERCHDRRASRNEPVKMSVVEDVACACGQLTIEQASRA